jgi:hypothetical protein
MDWTALLTSLGVSGVLFTAFAFLVRSIIVHFLSKDIERYKFELLKATHEHQVRFNNVYDKQAQVIAEFFGKLVEAKRWLACVKLTNSDSFTADDKENAEKAISATLDALLYFDLHSLYFEDHICEKVHALSTEMVRYTGLFSGLAEMMEGFTPEQRSRLNVKIEGAGLEKHFIDTWKAMDDKIPSLLRDLTIEFRRQLGVSGKSD